MCGIVGVIPKNSHGFWQVHQKMFNQLLYADALRGQDATGVIGVLNNGDFAIAKEATPAIYFQYSYEDGQVDKEIYSKGAAAIGHNRYATIGNKASDSNAHPFVVDSTFAMVHNGSLRQHKKLADTEVDSEALAIVIKQAMDQDDWKESLENVLGKVDGAYACAWFDQKRNEVCMVRNKERPLALIRTEHGVLFGSEINLLVWIASRNGSKIEDTLVVPVDTLIRFDLNKGGALFEQVPLVLKAPYTRSYQNGTGMVLALPKRDAPTTKTSGRTTTPSINKSQLNKILKGGSVDVSKQQYKRFRERLINKEILFEADDWVEAQLFQNTSKFVILGESKNGSYDICDFKHIVKTCVDITHLNLTKTQMEKQVFWRGTVNSIDYTPSTKTMEIVLRDATPSSILLTHETSTTTH